MNARITSIENLIATDPAGRNIFGLALSDQLRLAAQSLRLARRVGIVSGFYIPEADGGVGAGETDGPPGAKVLGEALAQLGIEVDYITDTFNAPLFKALGLTPIVEVSTYIASARPSHLVAIERAGRCQDGRYRNMRGVDITDTTPPLDDLFREATQRGLTTIGIGDGGNEIGMGKLFAATPTHFASLGSDIHPRSAGASDLPKGSTGMDPPREIQCVIPTDFCIVAGVSNWGAIGLAGALSVLHGRDFLPPGKSISDDLERVVRDGGAVDGLTHKREPTTDGQEISVTLRLLEEIRRQIAPSPLSRGLRPARLRVGILGYGRTGQAAAELLQSHGHRVCISDEKAVTLAPGTTVAAVESGGHTIEFLERCDLVVASPGVPADQPILDALHRRGIYVISEMELAYQLGAPRGRVQVGPVVDLPFQSSVIESEGAASPQPSEPRGQATGVSSLIAVTGTVGKRTTVELLERLFHAAGRPLAIGGNRGEPLSALLCVAPVSNRRKPSHRIECPIAVAVSSFQLETIVHFRPAIAVLLNIDEAHLDRHRSVAEYVRIKSRIFMNQGASDALILPFDDERVRTLARKHQGRTYFVSARQAVDRGAWLVDGCVRLNTEGEVVDLGPANPEHPVTFLSALLAARLSGIPPDELAEAWASLGAQGGVG